MRVATQQRNQPKHQKQKRATLADSLSLNGGQRDIQCGAGIQQCAGHPVLLSHKGSVGIFAALQRPVEQRAKEGEFGCISSGMYICLLWIYQSAETKKGYPCG